MRKATTRVGLAILLVATLSPANAQPGRMSERAVVEQTVRDSIGWALTKDRALLERIIAHDADLFIFHPGSKR